MPAGRKRDPLSIERRAYARHHAQARYRNEEWAFTWDIWWRMWRPMWSLRGRDQTQWCMARRDPDLPWCEDNTLIINRKDWLHEMVRMGGEFSKWRDR
jgi:hypothetical protein